MKQITKQSLPFLLCFSLVAGCSAPAFLQDSKAKEQGGASTSEAFDSFCDELFRSEVCENTINLHFTLSHPEAYGIKDTPITLGTLSSDSIAEANAFLENTLSALERFDYSSLSSRQKLTHDVLSSYLSTQLSASDFYLHEELLRPSTGIHSQLPVLYAEYRFYDKEDVEDYLELIALTPDYFSQIIAFEQEKAKADLFMADFSCHTVIAQCEDFVTDTKEHYLITTFNNRVDALTDLSDEERQTFKERNARLVEDYIFPAYDMLADEMEKLLGSGSNDQGLCYFADGTEYYEHLVAYNTGCSESVEEIQKMIEEQRLSDLVEITAISKANPSLWADAQSVTLSTAAPEETLAILETRMQEQFPKPPNTQYAVSYIDKCMEEYMAPAFYITPPIDDFERNAIYINASTDSSSMEYFTTLAHEGFPGHLYQTVMSYEAGLPSIRSLTNFSGYVEGWATYVEMISYQYAGLDENIAKMLSFNQSLLLSLYAGTDIGIHYEGWSLEDAKQFWASYGIKNDAILQEIYEFIAGEPSHYLKYYVGYLKFLELKDKAQKTYGSDYSDIAFHQAILEIGPAPFDVLERYLDEYYVREE